ncbi:MAG: hypothetical protein MHM6MM_006407 [Cercozoa sp. M6MM]
MMYAMKELSKEHVVGQSAQWTVVNEKRAMAKLSHPFIVNLRYALQDKESLYLVQDLCLGGDLKFHLRIAPEGFFEEPRARFYAAELLLALEHVHSKRILFRDMKPANVLLDDQGHVKLSDFGLVIQLPSSRASRLAGTPGYWAPEVLARKSQTYSADWWSWAVCLFEFLTGHRPQVTLPRPLSKRKAQKGQYEHKAENVADLLKGDPTCPWTPFQTGQFVENHAKRGGKLVLSIRWPAGLSADARDLLSRILVADPQKRLTSQEIKNHKFFRHIEWHRLLEREMPPHFVPKRFEINTSSLASMCLSMSTRQRVLLTPENTVMFNDFDYISRTAVLDELREVLRRNERAETEPKPKKSHGSQTAQLALPEHDCCRMM